MALDTAGVAAATLRELLDGEHAPTRDRVREALALPELAPVLDMPMAEYRRHITGLTRRLAQAGETSIAFPPAYGGKGEVGASIAGFETFAFGDLSLVVKIGVQFGLFGGAVLHLGTQRHHEAHLSAIASMDLPGCFAMTEVGHGSNVQELRTTATYDPETDELVVHTPHESATKEWIGNAACDGRMAAVFCQLHVGGDESRGVHCVLVPIRDDAGEPLPGVTIADCGHKLGLNGVDNGRLAFDRVRVPRENLLDRYAQVNAAGAYFSPIANKNKRFFTMLGTLIQGRVSVGGAGVSVSKVALAVAVAHALQRRQFAAPGGGDEILLLDYRTHQRRLLPALATTYGLSFAQQELIADTHRAFTEDDFADEERRRLETRAAALKSMATWHATHTVQSCRESCGGAGYMSSNRFAALKADSDVFTTFEGDNVVLQQLVAKNLLTGYRDQFGELDPLGTAAFVAGQVWQTVVERTAARELVTRIADELRPGEEDRPLRDREWQLELFEWREEHVISTAARRLKGGIDAGRDPFEVFNDAQDHVLLCAKAHVERLVLEAFDRAVRRCRDEAARDLLDRLCSLYALWHVETDRGWFQEHGRLSSTRSKAVLKAVNELCAEVRPHARALVDAFGIPEQQLAHGIGREQPAQALRRERAGA